MAHLIPSDLTEAMLSDPARAELETLSILKRLLPSNYAVFHGVHLPQLQAYANVIRHQFPGKPVRLLAINWMSEGLVSTCEPAPQMVVAS